MLNEAQNKQFSENNENNENNIKDTIVKINIARSRAVKILHRFERSDAYLDKLMNRELTNETYSPQDKALLSELVYGVIRWRWKLDWVLTGFYRGDYLKCLNIVKNALRVALYQILFLDRVPVHAAINESVEIIKRIQGEKIAGLVNGILRNISRNIENIRFPDKEQDIAYYLTIMSSHPRWMVRRWLEIFDKDETIALLSANNEKPDITIRINSLKSTSQEVQTALTNLNYYYIPSPYFNDSIKIKTKGINLNDFDLFKEGKITVQDTSATLATRLVNAKDGDRIIDVCAAPGGKSFGIAEMANDNCTIIAIDKYPSKLKFIDEGAKRLNINSIQTMEADATVIQFDEKADIVLADVPCSGLGTISKHPDIKWKRDTDDIQILTVTQRKILENAASLVKVGGVLIYSTCTIEPAENQDNVKWFLENHPEFEIEPAEKFLHPKVCKDGFLQTFPHIHSTDGAFAARLVKIS